MCLHFTPRPFSISQAFEAKNSLWLFRARQCDRFSAETVGYMTRMWSHVRKKALSQRILTIRMSDSGKTLVEKSKTDE